MPLRTVDAVRYITPLREGGSLPALIEASDGKQYVTKLRGAGQGTLALVAEVISGEIARTLGLRVPEIVLVRLDREFGRQERDTEIRHLLRASEGLNAGLLFLPEATTFDPAAGDRVDPAFASLVVWLDAFTLNVDRTSRNANMLLWKDEPWLIDHGASLYFHHNWPTAQSKVESHFEQISEHVLLPFCDDIGSSSALAHDRLSSRELERIVSLAPDDWLVNDESDASSRRTAYVQFLSDRLRQSSIFEQEVRHGGHLPNRTTGV